MFNTTGMSDVPLNRNEENHHKTDRKVKNETKPVD